MFGINLKHSLVTVAVAAGLLAAAGSASAATHQSGVVGYNGHAAGVTDGTSNTIAFGAHAAALSGFSGHLGSSENIAADGLGADYSLMADMGAQMN
jgi:hypothetical protein